MSKTMIAVLAAAFGAGIVHAGTVTMVVPNTSSGSSDWNVAATWSDGLAPHSGDDYVITNRLNTPAVYTAPQTFGGDSLQLEGASANFQPRGKNDATDAVIVNLIFNGGKMQMNQASTTYCLLQGTISVVGDTTIQSYQTATAGTARNLQIDSLISGGSAPSLLLRGSSGFISAGDQYIQMNNAANTFSGLWDIQNTRGIFASSGATGAGSFLVRSGGYLRIDDSWGGDMQVSSGAVVDVNSGDTYTLSSLTVDGSAFTELGTYTAAELNAATGTSIFTGDGSIQVIPEPATLGLVAVFGGGVLLIRRRFAI